MGWYLLSMHDWVYAGYHFGESILQNLLIINTGFSLHFE